MEKVRQIDKDVVKGILLVLSEGRSTVTYGELSKIIEGASGRRINPHMGFNVPLGRIQDYCIESDVPCLSALVVNQDQIPGSGFIEQYRKANPFDKRSDQEILEDEQKSCLENQDWSHLLQLCDIAPDELWNKDMKPLGQGFLNWSALVPILDQYEDGLVSQRDEEVYKWKALKHFNDHWDIDAQDFHGMLCESLSMAENLLTSSMYFARGMIDILAENDPEAVRGSFKLLFDNSIALDRRMESFSDDMDIQLAALNAVRQENGVRAAKNHYQDAHAMSVYLTLHQDDEHYIYKYRPYESFAARVGAETPKDKYEKVESFEALCTVILDYLLSRRKDLVRRSDELLPEELRDADSSHHMLAQDIVFYASWGVARSWAYAPGEQARYWPDFSNSEIMGIGWGNLGDPSQFGTKKELKEALIEAYKGENPKNDTDSIWSFVHDVRPGDVIWARRGTKHVVGCGIVKSEFKYEPERIPYQSIRDVEWIDMEEFDVEGSFHQRTLYELTEKTSVKTSELDDLSQGATAGGDADGSVHDSGEEARGDVAIEGSCWWLNANPKIWSFAETPVGEVQSYTLYNESGNKRRIFQHFLDAAPGDIVIGYESNPVKQIVALGKIVAGNDGEEITFKKTEALANPIDYQELKGLPELQEMEFFVNPNGSLFKVSPSEYATIIDLIREYNPILKTESLAVYDKQSFLSEVYLDSSEFDKLERVLRKSKNLVLQGAPGTGKTFAARRLAYAMMGVKDEARIKLVQFHQNYSYEDFVMGFKPEGDTFRLKSGIFYEFCKTAESHPEDDYFFIIDEINRGNMSKVFGELLMLIEASHRGDCATLAYTGMPFSVPENLYIIGMMNTADRSLAMIDYALRRRFSFYEMEPAFDSEGFKRELSEHDSPQLQKLVGALRSLNREIEQDQSLGKGFRIGHSYLCGLEDGSVEELSDIVELEIAPMLEEYWYDDEEKVADWTEQLGAALK